jgi:glycosyltransferase involved in cell wall biosynthesis
MDDHLKKEMRHIVIIAARNEGKCIEKTLQSFINQTEVPNRLYVVDDGSSDATPKIVMAIAEQHPFISYIRKNDRGSRSMGGGVVETFSEAYTVCRTENVTYISKIDADMVLPSDYFERLLRFMDGHLNVGAASGTVYELIGGKTMRLRMPRDHVPGGIKTIRKKVFDKMGGFIPTLGWDIIDLVKIRALGYETTHLDELKVIHLRQHGSAEGLLKGKAQWGTGAYIIGSHPLFIFARGIYRMLEPPYVTGGIAFWWGYLRAAATRVPRIQDKELIKALRKEQLQRMLLFNRLPRKS